MKVLDSTVLVDIDRGRDVKDRVRKLDREGRHAVSVVTVTELFYGVEQRYRPHRNFSKGADAMELLLSRFEILPLTRTIAVQAAETMFQLKKAGRPIADLHDIYIAATAIAEKRVLVTANMKHFEHIEGLTVKNWEDY